MSAPISVDKIKGQIILSVNSENSDLYCAAFNMLLDDFVRTKDEFVLRLKLYEEIYLVALVAKVTRAEENITTSNVEKILMLKVEWKQILSTKESGGTCEVPAERLTIPSYCRVL